MAELVNNLLALKQIPYDMGHLTLSDSDSCQIALPEDLEVKASHLTTIQAKEGPPHPSLKNK